jgi:hypothetical protein
MKSDNVVIKKSKIHSKGIFALRNFKKGEVVLHYDISHKIIKTDFDKMSNRQKEYISFLDGKYIKIQEPEKYVNHSCDPNTKSENFCDIAIKNIKIGEEITSDYSNQLAPNVRMKCNCGNKKCRKIIYPQ